MRAPDRLPGRLSVHNTLGIARPDRLSERASASLCDAEQLWTLLSLVESLY